MEQKRSMVKKNTAKRSDRCERWPFPPTFMDYSYHDLLLF